ncbi:hypothetical protein [Leifsonia virtsii]|uniref:Peptidase inhibitor family I36 n=1 Tax=Leifsonia virtsii TaxID=3035915 RepID=A0ABT8IYU6_9MICO|nr:hypothetical protein [Leifsonia virtsii]MDN4597975.1 hypothetical protein [Leifsonia virtsii]
MAIRISARARRLLASGVAIAALSIGLVSVGGTANAATAEQTSAPAQSCSYDIGTRTLVCVDAGEDLNEAVLEEAHLRVVEPAGAEGAVAAATFAAAGVQATFIQSQLYDDANYGGSFFQITNSSACNGSTTWNFGPLGNVGWSGRVSSFKSFSGCSTKLWQGTNYSGASYGYAVNAASLGSMNDQANSVSMR